MTKKLLVIFFVLLMSVVFVHGLTPSRCLITAGLNCLDFYVNPSLNQVHFTFANYLGESADFSFKALITGINISSVSCLCNNEVLCNIPQGKTGEVNCTFPPQTILSQGAIKIDFSGSYALASNPGKPIELMGQIYTRSYASSYSASDRPHFIIYFIYCVAIFGLIVYIIIWLRKNRVGLSHPGLRGFCIALAVFFVLVNIFIIKGSMSSESGIDPFTAPLYALIISLIPALLVGVIVSIISYIRHRKKKAKKK